MHSVRFNQRLGDGRGGVYQAAMAVTDGSDRGPPAYEERSASFETVIVGDRQWLRRARPRWAARASTARRLPAA